MEFCKWFLRQNGIKQHPGSWRRGMGWCHLDYFWACFLALKNSTLHPIPSPIAITQPLCSLPQCSIGYRMSVLVIQWDFPRTLLRTSLWVLGKHSTLLTMGWCALTMSWWAGDGLGILFSGVTASEMSNIILSSSFISLSCLYFSSSSSHFFLLLSLLFSLSFSLSFSFLCIFTHIFTYPLTGMFNEGCN